MRLRQPEPKEAWGRFVALYTPFLAHLLVNRMGAGSQDAAHVIQEIFLKLLHTLPTIEDKPEKGQFRDSLLQVCCRELTDWRRKQLLPAASDAELSGLQDGRAAADIEQLWQRDHNPFLMRRALEILRGEFQPATWKACWQFVVNERPAAAVAQELGITENAVFIAECRVIVRLKQELDGLVSD
jgi:RNA polymerase sigma-70 factor (ECF subfamily)